MRTRRRRCKRSARYLRCGECSGQGKRTVLQGTVGEEGGLLWLRWPGPIQNFPYASVNEASAKLLQEAERSYRGQRVSMQRHWLRVVGGEDLHKQLGSQANSLGLIRPHGRPGAGDLPVAVQLQLLHAVPTFEPLVLVDLAVRQKRVDHSSVGAKDEAGQSASAEHENSGADF
uniref:Uncharacterized protein n=1 Tax=Macrostomum lignano TaxID=282301 RepID=A0A1I8IE76_9PLAT